MRSVLLVLVGSLALSAAGESFQARLDRANEHLQSGNPAKARELYEQLQVDDPDAEIVRYGIATTYYREAERALQEGNPEKAEEAFTAAEQAYQPLQSAQDERIRTSASFAGANITAERAKMKVSPENYEESVAGLRKAVSNYEALVREHPDYAPARQNLDHMRYQLKKLLQQPPPEEKQDQDQDPKEGVFIGITEAATDLPGKAAEIENDGMIVNLTDRPEATPTTDPEAPAPAPAPAAPATEGTSGEVVL